MFNLILYSLCCLQNNLILYSIPYVATVQPHPVLPKSLTPPMIVFLFMPQGEVMVMGLNNHHQIHEDSNINYFFPTK